MVSLGTGREILNLLWIELDSNCLSWYSIFFKEIVSYSEFLLQLSGNKTG